MLEALIIIIAVPLNLTYCPLTMYYHTFLIDNGFGSRQFLLSAFRAALESPFGHLLRTAIPPPAALCSFVRRPTLLSHRFLLFL